MKPSLLVISSYPPLGATHHKAVVGVATYTKNTLAHLLQASKKNSDELKITVLAEKLKGASTTLTDEGIQVKRVWKRNSLFSQLPLFRYILTSGHTTLLLELELAMLGGPQHLFFLPILLFLARLKRLKTVVVLHQVISSASDVHGQLNLPQKSLLTSFYSFLLQIFYKIILVLSSKAIVFDEHLKDELIKITHSQKVIVIPHGIEDLNFPEQISARRELRLPESRPILLYFGYLAWYKGTDSLLDEYEKIPAKDRPLLLIAGGPNPNHTDKTFYKKYLRDLEDKATKSGAIITGFIEEKDIPTYFAASSICILPYRTFMSSSGPLSFVISALKPFLISSALAPLFKTQDIKELLAKEEVDPEALILKEDRLQEKVHEIMGNKNLQTSLRSLEKTLKEKRSWSTIGSRYYEEIFS